MTIPDLDQIKPPNSRWLPSQLPDWAVKCLKDGKFTIIAVIDLGRNRLSGKQFSRCILDMDDEVIALTIYSTSTSREALMLRGLKLSERRAIKLAFPWA